MKIVVHLHAKQFSKYRRTNDKGTRASYAVPIYFSEAHVPKNPDSLVEQVIEPNLEGQVDYARKRLRKGSHFV